MSTIPLVLSKSYLEIWQTPDFSKYNAKLSHLTEYLTKKRTVHSKPLHCVLYHKYQFIQKEKQQWKRKGRFYCHSVQQSTAIISACRVRPVELVVAYCMIISGPLGALVKGFMLCCSNRIIKMPALTVIEALLCLHLQNSPLNEILLCVSVYMYVTESIGLHIQYWGTIWTSYFSKSLHF